MDPFSAEGELLNISNTFHQGQYQNVLEFDTSSLSTQNKITARTLQLRAQIALGQAQQVLASLPKEERPYLGAVKAFTQYVLGDTSAAVQQAESLAESSSNDAAVQVLCGTILHLEGRTEEALALLSNHQGSLEALALTTQIHLSLNRTDLAAKEVQAARKWAQDSLLVNIAESWVGLRIGGEKYQQAYYVFEELAQAPSTSAPKTLVGQAVAELHLGRLPEAEVALQQALEKDAGYVEAIANLIVLNVIAGKDIGELEASLQAKSPEHPMLLDLQEKSDLFDQAAIKYSPKVTG